MFKTLRENCPGMEPLNLKETKTYLRRLVLALTFYRKSNVTKRLAIGSTAVRHTEITAKKTHSLRQHSISFVIPWAELDSRLGEVDVKESLGFKTIARGLHLK
jgi:hypothetical protein